MANIIDAKNVIKKFHKLTALNDVTLIAQEGKVTGLLGPNGAGKTTLIRALSTLIPIEGGSMHVDNIDVLKDPNKVRSKIGLAGQFAAVDDYLTGRETLEMVSRLYGLTKSEAKERSTKLLKDLGLTEAADRQAKTYSGGMRRRLDLGASLVATPRILFLDEPTTGLDPRTRLQLWDIIRKLVSQGVSILLTTQYLEEADALCDYIYVIDKGKVVIKGTSEELKSSLGKDIIEVKIKNSDVDKAADHLQKLGMKTGVDKATRRIVLHTTKGSDDLLLVANTLQKNKIKAEELSLHRPTLDDVFLEVTGEKEA